jgi:hypothetical protein
MGGVVHSRIRRRVPCEAADFKKTSTRRSAPICRIKGVVVQSIVFGNSGLRLAAVIVLVLSIKICGATYQQPNASDITSLPKGIQTHFLRTSRHPGFEIKKYLHLEKYGVHIMGTRESATG